MGDNINENVFSSCLNRRFVKYIGEILSNFFLNYGQLLVLGLIIIAFD